ncbi:MAG TPA: SDR family NAD(P)-dependent oxidoreductase [Candidatus Eisenbacteria bacterium]|nr:SDR family NAD(P)-dependent oxidoreductase [Candidatus Eisenbacteria bacterium]
MKEFRGRVAVVTGSASGIGLATAERLAAEGMRMVLADVEEGALRAASERLAARGATVLAVRTDVTKPEQVDALARRAYEQFGAVHVVFNNAGVEVTGAIFENSVSDLRWVVDVNLLGVLYGIRSFVPRMLEAGSEGHVVSTASLAGLTTAPYLDVYCVTKFGVVAAMECLYKELCATGSALRASVVCPGLINTNLMNAERNRPADRREPGTAAPSAGGMAMDAMLRAGLETGYPPSVVADAVFQGIRDQRFWVIPSQAELKANIYTRLDEVREERNPAIEVAGLPSPT